MEKSIIFAFFIVIVIAIVLLVWYIITKYKDKSPFGDMLSNGCYNGGWQGAFTSLEECESYMGVLSDNIEAQGWGHVGNRGIRDSSGAYGGAFGDPNIVDGSNRSNWNNWKEFSGVNARYREREEREDIYNQRYRRHNDKIDDEIEE